MTKRIISDALLSVNRILGLTSGGETQPTLLDDGNVSQVFTINDAVRRARAGGITSGWFMGILQNVHTGAGSLIATIDPYSAGSAVPALGSWPELIPRGLDIWVLGVSTIRTVGAGTLDGAVMYFNPTARQQAWGRDDSGVLVTSSAGIAIARWTDLDASAGSLAIGIGGNGDAFNWVRLRVERGTILEFRSDVATASATIRCNFILGLFPEGLGQDVAS